MKQNLNSSIEMEKVNRIRSILLQRGRLLDDEKESPTRIVNAMIDYLIEIEAIMASA